MILVTGGTGTIGARLVSLLLDEGEGVRVFCRDAEEARASFGDRADVAQGDLGDAASVQAALEGVDRVFLLTPSSQEQLEQERNVIRAAKAAGVRRVVRLSILGADEQSPVQLVRWHRDCEQELEASGLPHTVLRAAFFMQNVFRMVADGSIYTAAGDGKVAMVDAHDIAAAAAAVLTEEGHDGKTYAVTGPEAISFDDAAEKLSAGTGREIKHVRVPAEGVVEGAKSAGMPEWYAEDLAAIQGDIEAGHKADTSGDVKAVTGREARSFDEFARKEFAQQA